jgi:isopenicillin-N N-acyltransferase-like protein
MDDTASPFPLVRIASPDARVRGHIMGEEARDRVHESIAAYQETFGYYTGLTWGEIKELALQFAPPIEMYDREIFEEIRGVAEGAGLTLGDLLALNARSEIMYGLDVPTPPECTAFFADKTATVDGHVLLGQNWDWRPRAIESTTLFEVDQGPDRPALVMLPEAGLIGKTGFNEHGIGVTLNALVSDLDIGERQVPIHVILRGILNARTLEEAFAAVVRIRRGASANYMIADADGTGLGIEVGPGGVENVQLSHPVDGVLAHANHFDCPIDFRDTGREKWPDTVLRSQTMRSLLEARRGTLGVDSMVEVLRDDTGSPDAICRFPNPANHPVDQSATVASVVMDLTTRQAEIAAGPPSETDFVHFTPRFSDTQAGERHQSR